MSEKRKDKKGRIFRSGEGQRPNKTYFYRYHRNGDKKWCYVYAPTLEELRQKEEVIQRDLLDGIDYVGGEITVAELVDRYINLRRGLKENSMSLPRTSFPLWRKVFTRSVSSGTSTYVEG